MIFFISRERNNSGKGREVCFNASGAGHLLVLKEVNLLSFENQPKAQYCLRTPEIG